MARWCLLALMIASPVSACFAQTQAEQPPSPLHVDFTPLGGYRTGMTFPTLLNGQQSSANLILQARPSYGFAIGVRLSEEDLVEFRWARQDTHFRLRGRSMTSDVRVVLDEFHGDFTHEYVSEDWPAWSRPFVIGSIGATHIWGKSSESFTRFSFGLGGGIKIFFNRRFGLKMQAEWLPLAIDPEINAFVCGGGCVVHLTTTVVSQGEFVIGPVFRF
jgi:hypothetical protein